MRPGQGAMRLGRVLAFALSAVGVGSAAHVAGGGEVPVAGMLLSLPLVMIAVNPLAARRRGLPVLAGAMAGVQALLHVAFMMADGQHGTCEQAGVHGHEQITCGPMQTMSASPLMLAAHVLAAALLVGLLAKGEAALWALADWAAFRLRRWTNGTTTPRAAGSSPSLVMVLGVVIELRDRPAHAHPRRGPPVAALT